MEAWKEELYHHGILGMKWGKKNGPPYPLGASDHSASEKKAGWRKSLGRIRSSREDRNEKKLKRRNNYVESLEGQNRSYERDLKENDKDLQDLNKNGLNSKLLKKGYGNDWNLSDKEFADYLGMSKREALDLMIGDIERDSSWKKTVLLSNKKEIASIKSKGINEKTIVEARASIHNKAQVIRFVTGIAGTSIAVGMGYVGWTSPGRTFVNSLLAIGGSYIIAGSASGAMTEKAYKKYVGK